MDSGEEDVLVAGKVLLVVAVIDTDVDPGGHDSLVSLEHELEGAVVVIDTDVDPGEEDVLLDGEGVVLLDVETADPGGRIR